MAVTWNPADKSAFITLSNGDLTATTSSATKSNVRATRSVSSGKWYWEVKVDAYSGHIMQIGIGNASASLSQIIGHDVNGYGYEAADGDKYHDGYWGYGSAYGLNDIIGVALDLDNGKIWWSKNGIWQNSGNPAAGTGQAFSGVSGTFFPMIGLYGSGSADTMTARFNSYDSSYSPPAGFDFLFQPFNLLDGKVSISPKIKLLDGKVSISPKIAVLDGKTKVKDSAIKLLDGKSWITNLATNLLDGKGRIKDVATDLVDGKARVKDTTIDLLDGKGRVKDVATNLFDGKTILHPIVEANIEFPSFVIEVASGSNASLDETLSLFELESFSGTTADIEFPGFDVESLGHVGSVYKANTVLPKFSVRSEAGARVDIQLLDLDVSASALVGVTATADVELPLIKLDASALLDILANLDLSLPKLRVTSDGIYGAVVSGSLKLYPLRLNAEGYAGKVGTVDVSLPSLVMDGKLAHVPVGEGNMELPYFIVDADGDVTRDPCLGPYILKYRR